MIKLSICIPTFNRAPLLAEALDSIFMQHVPDLQVVICDNASEDNTEELVRSYQKRFGNVVYYRWDRNVGPDRNYLKTVELATGEYCWLFGSDDALPKYAVSRVLAALEERQDIYLFNRLDCSSSLKNGRETKWLDEGGGCRVDTAHREQLFVYFRRARLLGAVFSYLSSIVVLKSAWTSIEYDSTMTGTAYSHAYILNALLARGAKLQYLDEALVLCRRGNDSFAAAGAVSRFMLDIDGYLSIAHKLFAADAEASRLFLAIVVREHPWYRLAKVKFYAGENWPMIETKLAQCGYNKQTILLARLIGSLSPLIKGVFLLKRLLIRARLTHVA